MVAPPSRRSSRPLAPAPGTVATHRRGERDGRRARPAAPARRHRGSATATGPTCGTDPVELNAYFETGFDLPFKLSDEFTKQYPNVTWKISQDQFTNLMNATPRLLSGDNPPDLIRLPSMVSLVKDGLLKNLDGYVTAFGWDKLPAGSARPEPGRHGRHPRLRLALCGGTQLQPDRRLLQQEARPADRHDRAARRRSPSSRPCSRRRRMPVSCRSWRGMPRPAAADSRSRSRTSWRPTARPTRSTTGSSRSRAPRSIRRPISRPPSTSSSGSRPATSRRTSTRSSTPTRTRDSARAKACSCSMATGRTPPTTRTSRRASGSSSSRR